MKLHKWEDIKRRRFTPEQLERITRLREKQDLELSLAELRKLAGKTQVEVAQELEMAQAAVSSLETRDDRLVSTLRRYVEALGGKLIVAAEIGNKTVKLSV